MSLLPYTIHLRKPFLHPCELRSGRGERKIESRRSTSREPAIYTSINGNVSFMGSLGQAKCE